MLVHTVMAKFLDKADGRGKLENIAIMRDEFSKLHKEISDVKDIKFFVDDQVTPGNYDMVFVSRHENRAKLAEYLNNPAYLNFAGMANKFCQGTISVDSTSNY